MESRLHPKLRIAGADYFAMMELISPLRVSDLRETAGTAKNLEYEIKRAYDIVLSGV